MPAWFPEVSCQLWLEAYDSHHVEQPNAWASYHPMALSYLVFAIGDGANTAKIPLMLWRLGLART
jgi:hypothetical protein